MKRVLEVNVDDKGFGGVFVFVMNVMRSIDCDRFVLDIAAFEPFEKDAHKESVRSYGGEVYECHASGNFIIKQWNTCYKFYKLLRTNKYQVMHIHSDVAYKLLLYGLVGRFAGVENIIVHSHSSGVEGKMRLLKKILQTITKPILSWQPFTKLACSNRAAQWMYMEKTLTDVQIVTNGICLDRFRYSPLKQKEIREKLGINPTEKIIGTVARFSFQKYPEKLLSVFREVLKIDSNYTLLWIGTGPLMEGIKKQAEEWEIAKSIIFYGNTDSVADMYQAMDVFVLTSRFEGLCIAAIEAQASGSQCVCSDALTPETGLVSSYHAVPLDASDSTWAKKVIEYAQVPKRDVIDIIREKGYDIQQTVNILDKLYAIN